MAPKHSGAMGPISRGQGKAASRKRSWTAANVRGVNRQSAVRQLKLLAEAVGVSAMPLEPLRKLPNRWCGSWSRGARQVNCPPASGVPPVFT